MSWDQDKKYQKKMEKEKKEKENDDPPTGNKGKMQADATVADQYIKYPTDTNLLNESRKKLEGMIDKMYEDQGKQGVKPRTYRRILDKAYLRHSKKRRKTKSEIRKMNRRLLEGVSRDLRHVDRMLDAYEKRGELFPLTNRELKYLWVIRTIYMQQLEMYKNKTHKIADRIVSLHQPHVRPILRGKDKARVEFGSKLSVSLDRGFAIINKIGWNAYNESGDLKEQVEKYREIHGYYPELVQVDKIYATRENRRWLKERGIRITAAPLGRQAKESPVNYYQKRKRRMEAIERNAIEGKFGQGKNGYELNRIRARLRDTSESWISCIFFVMNLLRYEKVYFWPFLYRLFSRLREAIYRYIFSKNKLAPSLTGLNYYFVN